MKTGEAAKLLDVATNTVKNWIDNPSVSNLFSLGARGEHGGAQRVLTESDILILNTIRHLRNIDGLMDWDEIAERLNDGEREQEFPQNAISGDPRTIPLPQAEQSAKAMATMAERDAALKRVSELEREIIRIRDEREKDRERYETQIRDLNELIAKLNREIGRLEGRFEARDRQ